MKNGKMAQFFERWEELLNTDEELERRLKPWRTFLGGPTPYIGPGPYPRPTPPTAPRNKRGSLYASLYWCAPCSRPSLAGLRHSHIFFEQSTNIVVLPIKINSGTGGAILGPKVPEKIFWGQCFMGNLPHSGTGWRAGGSRALDPPWYPSDAPLPPRAGETRRAGIRDRQRGGVARRPVRMGTPSPPKGNAGIEKQRALHRMQCEHACSVA